MLTAPKVLGTVCENRLRPRPCHCYDSRPRIYFHRAGSPGSRSGYHWTSDGSLAPAVAIYFLSTFLPPKGSK